MNTNKICRTLVTHDGTCVQYMCNYRQNSGRICLTTSEINKDIVFRHFRVFHNFTHQFKWSLPIHLRRQKKHICCWLYTTQTNEGEGMTRKDKERRIFPHSMWFTVPCTCIYCGTAHPVIQGPHFRLFVRRSCTNLWRERLIWVELLWVSDCSVVGLVYDVS